MKEDTEKTYAKLISLETEVMNLRQGYAVVNQRYLEALGSLKLLTQNALDATMRAAAAAEKAAFSSKSCARVAAFAARSAVLESDEVSAHAAAMAAQSAVEAAAAVSSFASAATNVSAHLTEDFWAHTAAQAAEATEKAAQAAAEAIKMSGLAYESVRHARQAQTKNNTGLE